MISELVFVVLYILISRKGINAKFQTKCKGKKERSRRRFAENDACNVLLETALICIFFQFNFIRFSHSLLSHYVLPKYLFVMALNDVIFLYVCLEYKDY